MVRRKGEKPVPRYVRDWSPDLAVAGSMRRGDRWFFAWMAQETTPYSKLSKRTRIPVERLAQIERGATLTRVELEALAKAWWITPEGLMASMPDPSIVVG